MEGADDSNRRSTSLVFPEIGLSVTFPSDISCGVAFVSAVFAGLRCFARFLDPMSFAMTLDEVIFVVAR